MKTLLVSLQQLVFYLDIHVHVFLSFIKIITIIYLAIKLQRFYSLSCCFVIHTETYIIITVFLNCISIVFLIISVHFNFQLSGMKWQEISITLWLTSLQWKTNVLKMYVPVVYLYIFLLTLVYCHIVNYCNWFISTVILIVMLN